MHLRSRLAEIAHSIFELGKEPSFFDLTKCVDERSGVASPVFVIDVVKKNVRDSKPPHGPSGNIVDWKVNHIDTIENVIAVQVHVQI